MKAISESWAKLQCELGLNVLPGMPSLPIKIAVGLSGGRDSVALLHALCKVVGASQLVAIVLDHNMQARSHEWREQSEQWCRDLGVSVTGQLLSVQPQGQGLEAAARSARYTALKQIAVQNGALVLALGHHQDDQAETVLLQLVRGTGLGGAAAMPEYQKRDALWWWRPMLAVPRKQIDAYVQLHQLPFFNDPSNNDTDYRRNALRHQVLPALEAAFAQTKKSLAQFAEHAARTNEEIQSIAREDLIQCAVPSAKEDDSSAFVTTNSPVLLAEKIRNLSETRQRWALRYWLLVAGFTPPETTQLKEIMAQLLHSKSELSPEIRLQGRALRRYRERLFVVKLLASPTPEQITQKIHFERVEGDAWGLALSAIEAGNWQVKARTGGERIKLAMDRPSRSLKQHFQTLGTPVWEREHATLLYLNEHLAWVQGLGFDARFALQSGPRVVPIIG